MAAKHIKVIVKFRPTNKVESKAGKSGQKDKNSLKIVDSQTIKVGKADMIFDQVLKLETTQDEAFEAIAEASCEDLLNGFNSTIFVYGQTGSGKTYTMYGDDTDTDVAKLGVIPRSISYLFERLEQDKAGDGVRKLIAFEMKVSFVEIYNEKLRDLLTLSRDPPPVKIRMNREKQTYLENLSSISVSHIREVLKLIAIANKNRNTSATKQNATSSRGHLVMQVTLWQKIRESTAEVVQIGLANFCDLAGSERNKKTGATGLRLKEAQNINLSLTVLGRTISALASKKKQVVPYRESKLTHILKDSLGGNCKTTLVVAASTHIFNRDESINSLKFGQRCKLIKTKAKVNRIYTENELLNRLSKLEKENSELRALNGIATDFTDGDMKMGKDDQVFALQEELGEMTYAYNSEKNKVETAEKKLGFDLSKLSNENEFLSKKIEELRLIIEGIDAGHGQRDSLIAAMGMKGKDLFNNQVSGLKLTAKGQIKKERKKEKKRKKYWCWMNPEQGNGYKKYHQGLSTYLDEFEPNQEENVRINESIYLMCRAGKNRGFAEEVKTKIVLDLKRVNDEEFEKLNAKFR